MTSARKAKQPFGVHVSIAGGMHHAFETAARLGCDCMQVFVKNQRQWVGKPLTQADMSAWQQAAKRYRIDLVVAHATYLINLGSVDPTLWKKSVATLTDELQRCEALGISFLVFHPGAHLSAEFDVGLRRIIKGINSVHDRTRGFTSQLLLETTAGQGTSIGHRFEHLARILKGVREAERLDVCVDTCHIFAAGYPLEKVEDYQDTMLSFDEAVGVQRIKCFHVNDSKGELGSRIDRHEHIGKGQIGISGFRNLLRDARFQHVPKILETPKGEDDKNRSHDSVNLQRLRRAAKIS